MVGVVGDDEPEQEVLQRRGLLVVAEGGLHHLPERNVEVELLDLLPDGGRVVEVDLVPASVQAWKRVRTMLNNSGWSALATTAIILRSRSAAASSGGDQGLDLLEPLLGVEELAAVGKVVPQVLVHQAQLLQQDAWPGPPGSCGCRGGCRAASRPRSRAPRSGE